MADSAHLEKMGRELKCPICLSLLNSAVSLTCNHVFCNLCIMKSMKSGSSCPVCKVPYGRREVRPAPHMDNLVSIYKNMEVASGINIFVTQTAPLTKMSDELNQAKGERHFGTPGVGGTSSRKPRKKRMVKGKKTEELVKTNAEISGPHPVKPSFPAKKRVQVPQYPLSDTPTRPEKSEIAPVKSAEKESMDNSILSKEKLIFTEKGQPVFSPFFWLREGDDNEDDVGKSSGQLTEGDYVMVTPQKVPSFSDLKDSDTESPTTMTPTGGVHYEPKVAEAFDSEMFEWTQRACSPELCSTPIKKQDVNKDELDGIQERETLRTCTASPHSKELASENVKHMNAEQEAENKNVQFSIQASPKTKNAMAQDLMKKSNKRAKRANRAQSKRVKISLDEVLGDVPINSSKIAKNLNQGNMCANKGNARTLERRTSERGKKASFNTTATEEVLDVPTESIEPKIKNQGTKNIGAELGDSPGEEPGNVESLKLRCKARKSRQSFNINHQKIHKKKSENLKGDTVAKVLNEVSKNQGHEKENLSTQLPVLSCLMANDSETPDLGEESNKGAKKSKNQVYRELRGKKRLKNSTDDRAKDWMVDEVLHDSSKAAAKKAQNDNVAKVLNEVPKNQSQEKENLSTQLPVLSCLMVNDNETPDLEEKSNKKAKKVKNQAYRELKGNKRLKNYTDARKKNCMVNEVLHDSSKAAEKEAQTITEPEDLETGVIDNLEIAEKVLAVAKDRFLRKCENVAKHTCCAFCQSSEDSEASGEMMHYLSGKPVAADYNGGSNVIHSHRNCTEWAPNVYFEDDTAINLETELVRSRRIKCSCCGIKGAALGCYEKSCRKSFHVTCAKLVPQCRWDTENFVILCPLHSSSKLPKEISGHQVKSTKRPIPKGESHAQKTEVLVKHGMSADQLWKGHGSSTKWVLCCSALTMAEKETVSEFARLAGISVSKTWVSSVTHVIASTDENGTCRRTFKFLMGVLEGKWILKIDWIKACMKTMEPVDEEQYEISEDIHGIRDGPRLGRLRVLNQQSKLFNGFTFYFTGEFILSYKGYLQDLVVAAGGTVLQRKPISRDQGGLLLESSKSTTFIIYSLELPGKYDSAKKTMICNRRRADAEALAHSTGAKVASHSWVLDSIAACKLQTLV